MCQQTKNRISELLEYAEQIGKLNQKVVFEIQNYDQLIIWEHEVKGQIGIQHEVADPDGIPVWLRIERLQRIRPPITPESIREWIIVSNDPDQHPGKEDELIKTLPKEEAERLISEGVVNEADVSNPLNEQNQELGLKDVIFKLENNPAIKSEINTYLKEQWLPWSEEEKPRRATIKKYDSLYSLQQTIEAQGDGESIELIWGVGIARWLCEGHRIDHPLLEKPVEIEIDQNNGAILIHPKNDEPDLITGIFSALNNPGVGKLVDHCKEHFSKLSESANTEFSPYINDSFESVLKQARTCLSNKGTYWPDNNPDLENRQPNNVSDSLEITDSWVIFARPRSAVAFVQDIEKFKEKLNAAAEDNLPNPIKKLVTQPANVAPPPNRNAIALDGEPASATFIEKTELFFPKAFNEAQVQIIEKLECNDGVVVQGPPGTGKTHTIANIICHYLATGRTVLVTSKGVPALSVLKEQIPEELRSLTISLLTNERQEMKQMEAAIQQLSNLVDLTTPKRLAEEEKLNESRVKNLKSEIYKIDSEIKEWGLKQINSVDKRLSGEDTETEITAMELAEMVVNDSENHQWFPDEIASSVNNTPQFTNADIAKIREARSVLGSDIVYVGMRLPNHQDMLDSANIVAIHRDLVMSAGITNDAENNHIPLLAVTVEQSVDRARHLIQPLKNLSDLLGQIQGGEHQWLERIFYSWINDTAEEVNLFNDLKNDLFSISQQRQVFVTTLVEINDPAPCIVDVNNALRNHANGKKPFGFFGRGNKNAKVIVSQIRINGDTPVNIEQWQLALDYVLFQESMRKFIIRWNHAGRTLGLPNLSYSYGSLFDDIQSIYSLVNKANQVANGWSTVRQEIAALFPHGIDADELLKSKPEIEKAIRAVESNISRISLGVQRLKLQDLIEKLKPSNGLLSENIRSFINNDIGNPQHSPDSIMRDWQNLMNELQRINRLSPNLFAIEEITQKIAESGAPLWAKKLRTEPLLTTNDELTPACWRESWQWRQRRQYLQEIDGRGQLRELSDRRSQLDQDLKKTFSKLVRIKTNIGLHTHMTDLVKSALSRFVQAIGKIGGGMGMAAPGHRRDARKAMQDCFGGVPCWIMPTWRISESLPSDFGVFDLVIIDEASQSDITALPAIMRAKKLLIVGDDKQVSPSTVGLQLVTINQLKQNFLKNQPFAAQLTLGQSIYDLASVAFPGQRIMLTEHFRCVEPIIRFSMQFYQQPLIPLRIPKASEKLNPPLIDVYVTAGRRDERRKTNEIEAEAIVAEIKHLVSDPKFKGRSIGVISLIGHQQAQYIQAQLLAELGEDVYQDYQIACGDAATFQGKERDIMFLSMIVGPKQGIAMTKTEFEQRFNVALSRARDRMYLFRSVQATDLHNNEDLRLKVLHHFLNPMPPSTPVGDAIDLCDSEFERDVYKRLINKGYNVTPQVKVGEYSIDLVVEGENDRRLAIELDGDRYHPPEQWMQDWNRQRTMERVGWQFWRCWGSSYMIDPDGCINDLVSTLNDKQILPCENTVSENIYTEHRIYEKKTMPQTVLPS